MTNKTVQMNVAQQDIDIELAPFLTVLLHKDDMEVKSADDEVIDITPEMTVAEANQLPDGAWDWLREQHNFKRLWAGLWEEKPLPEKLETLAAKHTAGLILLIIKALIAGKIPHLLYPETYLHPSQQRMIAEFLRAFQEDDDEH